MTDSQQAPPQDRCVLFADVAGSTRLYEKLGDTEAKHTIERCLKRVSMAVESFGGRVIKTIGDAVMAVFTDTESCLQAACQMQQRVAELPRVGAMPLAIRVGFHSGPVLEENGDVFGDAVNLAARLVELARVDQIITSGTSVDRLSALTRQATRELNPVTVKGKAEPVRVCEVIWKDEGDLTLMAATPVSVAPVRVELRLRHANADVTLAPDWEVLTLGRDKTCDVVIADQLASRQHVKFERRGEKIVLIDQSTNGTWIAMAGEAERVLRREQVVVLRAGRLSFGHPWRKDEESVEFLVD
jgi:class 3 adenylate cyclase